MRNNTNQAMKQIDVEVVKTLYVNVISKFGIN